MVVCSARMSAGACAMSVCRLIDAPAKSILFPSWSAPGGVAQLGERLHGMQEVRGSSPLTSIFRE